MRHFMLLALCAAALAACGPASGTGDANAGADAPQAAAAPAVTDVACAHSYEDPSPMPALVDAFFDSDNDPVAATGVSIQAPEGAATCAGSLAGGVACQVRGPAVVKVAIQDFEYFTVPAGRGATLSVADRTTCFLNAE